MLKHSQFRFMSIFSSSDECWKKISFLPPIELFNDDLRNFWALSLFQTCICLRKNSDYFIYPKIIANKSNHMNSIDNWPAMIRISVGYGKCHFFPSFCRHWNIYLNTHNELSCPQGLKYARGNWYFAVTAIHFWLDNVTVPRIFLENVAICKCAKRRRLASESEDWIDRQRTDSSTLNCKD